MTRSARLPALVMFLACMLAACTGGEPVTDSLESAPRGSDGAGSATAGTLSWRRCRDTAASMAGLQCATLPVALEPGQPESTSIDLAVARLPSTGDPAERIGSLVLNPGGPGGSGIEFLASAAAAFPETLTDRFDLVSFDPRGVGASAPVHCVSDEVKDEQLQGDLSPDDEQELRDALADQADFLEGCQRRSGDLIEHMSTADVAIDLDALRAALGDEQLTYLGYSYGTAIGAVYATLFPERVRALVLDGAVSPSATDEAASLAQAQGFERTLGNFVAACNASPQCALAPDARGAFDAARARLERQPVTVGSGADERTLGPDQFDIGVATALYDSSLWGVLAESIAELDRGGAGVLLTMMDRQTGRRPDGSYDNSSDAQAMVSCADTPERPDADAAAAAAQRIIDGAPVFGQVTAFAILGCLGWPLAADPVPPLTGTGAPPVLVIGTVGDPATPYAWAEQMSRALESGILLTYEGDGHTAFLRGGTCIENAVVDYLVDLQVPASGTRCPAEAEGTEFAPLRDQVRSELIDAGLPDDAADCVIDALIAELGRTGFDQLILSNDQARLTQLVTVQVARCAAEGGD